MKRFFKVAPLLLLAAALLASCGGETGQAREISDYGIEYINKNLGGNYTLSFNEIRATNSGVVTTVRTYIVTDEGFYRYITVNENNAENIYEEWYVKNEVGMYTNYLRRNNGSVIKTENTLSKKSLTDFGGSFSAEEMYMEAYNDFLNLPSLFKNAGEGVIANRNCDRFLYADTNEYYIDRETGICMKFAAGLADGLIIEFEVTEFMTGGAELPVFIVDLSVK